MGVLLRLTTLAEPITRLRLHDQPQLTDTLQEANGLLTADRRPKLPVETFREIVTGSAKPVSNVTSTAGWTESPAAS